MVYTISTGVRDLLRDLVGRAVRDAAVRRAQPARRWRGRSRHRSRRADRKPDGPQADLDHGAIGDHFRGREVRLSYRLSECRTAVETDGNSALTAMISRIEFRFAADDAVESRQQLRHASPSRATSRPRESRARYRRSRRRRRQTARAACRRRRATTPRIRSCESARCDRRRNP